MKLSTYLYISTGLVTIEVKHRAWPGFGSSFHWPNRIKKCWIETKWSHQKKELAWTMTSKQWQHPKRTHTEVKSSSSSSSHTIIIIIYHYYIINHADTRLFLYELLNIQYFYNSYSVLILFYFMFTGMLWKQTHCLSRWQSSHRKAYKYVLLFNVNTSPD